MALRVMLGARRLRRLERFVDRTNVEAAYALCVALGRRPHWNAREGVLYVHSPLLDRRILVTSALAPGSDLFASEITAVVDDLRDLVVRAGGTLSFTEVASRSELASTEEEDAFVFLRPKFATSEGPELRAAYTHNQLIDSRLLALTVVKHIERHSSSSVGLVQFLWNMWADREGYHALTQKPVPSVLLEWNCVPGSETSPIARHLGQALNVGLEVALHARNEGRLSLEFDESAFERQMRLFVNAEPGTETGPGSSTEKSLQAAASSQSGVIEGKRKNESYTSGRWVSSRDFRSNLLSPRVRQLDSIQEQEARTFARTIRGG